MNTLLWLASTAFASPSFPGVVAESAGMACTPSCILCHESAAGSSGTATQPFVSAMLAAGLVVNTDDTVAPALDELAANGTDSDGDGVGDVDELAAGTNPNPDGADFCTADAVDPPQYGCFGKGAGLLGLGLFAAAFRRRGR